MTERDLATGYWSQSDAPKIASFKIDIHDVARIRFQFVANIRIKKISPNYSVMYVYNSAFNNIIVLSCRLISDLADLQREKMKAGRIRDDFFSCSVTEL